MHQLWVDLRGGFRGLRQNRLVAFMAVASLSLAIAGNTAIFSAISAMFLRPLPFEEAEQLVFLGDRDPANMLGVVVESLENFLDLRERAQSYEQFVAFDGTTLGLQGDHEPESVLTMNVSEGFFDAVRWKPHLGRLPLAEEEAHGAPPVALLSHSYWTARFGADPTIVGRELDLSGELYEVIGVLPADAEFISPTLSLFSPMRLGPADPLRRDKRFLSVFGRLADGVTVEEADLEMKSLSTALQDEFPQANRGRNLRIMPFRDRLVAPPNRQIMALIQGGLFFVLLIACANVANLLLARGQERTREIAVRAALGAGRRRIFAQLLTESLALTLTAFFIGSALAWAAIQALGASLAAQLPKAFQPQFDFRTLLFTAGIAILAGLIFGLVPALRVARPDLMIVLREGGRSGQMGARRWLAKGLVVGQLALALTLLSGSVILVDAVEWLQYSSPGFESQGLLTSTLQLRPRHHETDRDVVAFYRQARQRLDQVPGVEAASFVLNLPRSPFNPTMPYSIEGDETGGDIAERETIWLAATPGHFSSLGVALLQGREFTDADHADAPRVIVVNRSFARRHWQEASPIGERIVIAGEPRTVVGVAADIWQEFLAGQGDGRSPVVYLPHSQSPSRTMTMVARVAPGTEETAIPRIRAALWEVDPRLSIPQVQTFEQYVSQFFGTQGLGMMLTLFGGLALLLAAIGIYGVVAFSVGARTHEIGLRMALGAGRGEVQRLIGMEGLKLLLLGLAFGLPAVYLVSRAVEAALQQMVSIQPWSGLPMIVVLVVVALLAAYLPARRASRLQPTEALRYD